MKENNKKINECSEYFHVDGDASKDSYRIAMGESVGNKSIIYHFVDEKKLINILNQNEIKPRWKHYIETEDKVVVGTSFSWDEKHSTIQNMEYPIKLVFDRNKIENDFKTYLINSTRVHLQTMAMLKPNLYDPTAYTFESKEPNELFVEGVIKPLNEYLNDIILLKDVSNETKTLINAYKVNSMNNNESNINEDVNPEEVDLSSFQNKKKLNPYFFDENQQLKPKVRKRLLEIANDFYEFLETPWLKVEDIVFMGSLTNFNWSEHSDVDLHLVYDPSEVKDNLKITEEYFKLKKWAWSDKHENLNIYGYPIELYVQPSTQEEKEDDSAYSVQDDEWLQKPSYQVEPFDKEKVKQKASEIMNKIDQFYEIYAKNDKPEELKYLLRDVEKLWDRIKNSRSIGLDREGIFSFENIVFKVLRRTKYMEKITELKNLIYDKQNSLNENKTKVEEDIILPVEKGDTILTGKFKNKKTVVKDIDKDIHGMPTINGKQATTFRTIKENNESKHKGDEIKAEIIYHKSNPMFRELIDREGLNVKKGDSYMIHSPEDSEPEAIFGYIGGFDDYDSTYDDDIWKIDMTKIPNIKWYIDKEVWGEHTKAIITYENIPRNAIELIYKGTGKSVDEKINEDYSNNNNNNVFYHGSTDKNLSGKKGIHVGTKLAATQALQARIGVPAEGEWDGTREYGKTLLAGKKRLANKRLELGYGCETGYNCGRDVPEEDYYPTQRNERAKYSDGTPIQMNSKPIVFPVEIIGKMSNTPNNPHSDTKANSMMLRNLKLSNARQGYYYINDGEDEGSISAVVPNKEFLKIK